MALSNQTTPAVFKRPMIIRLPLPTLSTTNQNFGNSINSALRFFFGDLFFQRFCLFHSIIRFFFTNARYIFALGILPGSFGDPSGILRGSFRDPCGGFFPDSFSFPFINASDWISSDRNQHPWRFPLAEPGQFQSSFRAVSEQFQSSFSATLSNSRATSEEIEKSLGSMGFSNRNGVRGCRTPALMRSPPIDLVGVGWGGGGVGKDKNKPPNRCLTVNNR